MIIHPLTTLAEVQLVEALQMEIWGMPPEEVLPLTMIATAIRHGGVLLGAWDRSRLAGFLFGFPGLTSGGRVQHCSHIMGVLPEYRTQGVGQALKWAQRKLVLAQGIDLITWTYDPLEAPNARLNLHTLGAVCRTYLLDFYGEMPDALNAGLPSDRFEVEWHLQTSRVARRAKSELYLDPRAIPTPCNPPEPPSLAEGWPRPGSFAVPTTIVTSVVIPTNFQTLRREDPPLALAWRLHTREVFTSLFAAGYIAHDFVIQPHLQQATYVLAQSESS